MEEIIERKGIGHPDTICDNLAEELGKELIKEYKKQYGKVQHYNVDKVLASCGQVNYEKRKMLKPVKIVFSGNATKLKKVNKILQRVTERVLKKEISRGLKYKIYNHISYGSPDLKNNFDKRKCNDTSFSVGSLLTKKERMVLNIGEELEILSDNNHIGTDYKIMLINDKIVIALALILNNRKEYNKEKLLLKKYLENKFNIDININMADNKFTCFNTITGTSLEQGDAGMTGRGNRYNGLITPMKPMTMEAYYGKNNITHIGRIYQERAFNIAQKEKCNVLMINNIGGNINKPTIIKW